MIDSNKMFASWAIASIPKIRLWSMMTGCDPLLERLMGVETRCPDAWWLASYQVVPSARRAGREPLWSWEWPRAAQKEPKP